MVRAVLEVVEHLRWESRGGILVDENVREEDEPMNNANFSGLRSLVLQVYTVFSTPFKFIIRGILRGLAGMIAPADVDLEIY